MIVTGAFNKSMNNTSPTIFIVDDDEAVRFAISLLVQTCGWDPECYASAEEFLLAYTPQIKKACLVLDLIMPGMSGAELIEKLLTDPDLILPIIVITAFPDDILATRAREAGARAILKKPFNDQLLIGHIRQAINL